MILISAREPREIGPRRRFTLAHEVGHWICHCLEREQADEIYCRPVDVSEAADRDLEREANVFAADLIMPEPLVRREWAQARWLEAMCWRFRVSESAMRWRLFSLGLLEEGSA